MVCVLCISDTVPGMPCTCCGENLQGKNYVVGLSCETFVVYACIVMEVMYVYVRMPTIVTVCRQTLTVNIAKKFTHENFLLCK